MEAAPIAGNSELASGIFTWDIFSDTVFADNAVAVLYGIDPIDAARGLPIQRFLDRVHDEDRPGLAREIRHAMLTSEPFQTRYRVCAAPKVWLVVLAFGHCFRDKEGNPNHFSGIIHPVPTEQHSHNEVCHLLAAYQALRNRGADHEAELVVDVLKRLSNPGENLSDLILLYH